jgi:Rrf2 family protein
MPGWQDDRDGARLSKRNEGQSDLTMNVIRQHTDYALRLLTALGQAGGKVSAKQLGRGAKVSYYYTAKILQTLRAAGIVASTMGKRGGFSLARLPREITLAAVVGVVQGPVRLNHCLLPVRPCKLRGRCPIAGIMARVQKQLEESLEGATLEDILKAQTAPEARKPKARRQA